MNAYLEDSTDRHAFLAKLRSSALWNRDTPVNTAKEAIGWWESRRIAFNLIVGSAGILSCVVAGIAVLGSEIFSRGQSSMGSPLLAVFGALFYGIMANVCYTCGWIAELGVRRLWPREADRFASRSFTAGLAFSVLLTLAPGVVLGAGGLLALLEHFLRTIHR